MSSSCTPILVGVVSSVLEILLLSKMAKFPFRTMDYSPWSPKNLIDQNRLKKFMQVGIDVKFMHTNFGGCDLFGFVDLCKKFGGRVGNVAFMSLYVCVLGASGYLFTCLYFLNSTKRKGINNRKIKLLYIYIIRDDNADDSQK